jgi:chromosome segregation ATPase
LEDAFKHIGDSFEALIGDIELYNPSTAGRLRSLVEKERAAFDSVLKDLVADFNGAQDARAELEAALAAKESELVEVKKAERQERADKVSANEEIDELVAALRAKTEELERVEDGWKRTNAAILERARKAEADNDRLRAVMLEAASSIASGPLLPKQIAARLREEAGK